MSVSLYLGGTASYAYDAEGQRVRKVAGTAVEEYVYDSAGHQFGTMQQSGAMKRIELYAGARHLATYDIASNATYFIHGDWQGTERLRTNSAGAAYENCTNLPFGDNQTCSGGADISPMHFTGKPRDTETNLDYFGARYYNSGMARWMIPDWAAKPATVPYAHFGNPQSLNLYGYVTDNPVSRQDGDGHLITIYQLYMWHSGAQDQTGIMMAITGQMEQQQLDAALQKTKPTPAQPAATAPPPAKKQAHKPQTTPGTCSAVLPTGLQLTMVYTLMGEQTPEAAVGTQRYGDDQSGTNPGKPNGPTITDETLTMEAHVMAGTMLNLGNIGNAGTYTGLPQGIDKTNAAMKSSDGSPGCTQLKRDIGAVQHPTDTYFNHWKTTKQGNWVRPLDGGSRIAQNDFYFGDK